VDIQDAEKDAHDDGNERQEGGGHGGAVSSDFLPRIRGKGLPYHPITLHLSFDFSAFPLGFNVCLLACSVWCVSVSVFSVRFAIFWLANFC